MILPLREKQVREIEFPRIESRTALLEVREADRWKLLQPQGREVRWKKYEFFQPHRREVRRAVLP
jgi:hypothetical protein